MSSDVPTGVAQLAELLARAGDGRPPAPAELAELLWLSRHLPAPVPRTDSGTPHAPRGAGQYRSAAPPRGSAGPHRPAPDPHPHPDPPHAPGPPDSITPTDPVTSPAQTTTRIPLHLPARKAPADGTPRRNPDATYTSLLAPVPPMLPHPLALQRALRPLKRSVPAPVGQELDEAATARRIARLGADPRSWLPVLRPRRERWLTLHLVHDAGPTMPVWRPLVRELHTALAQSGIFRTVELHRLETDGTVRRPGSQESFADGRTVTLLVSDCMGPQWRGGPAGTRWYATLRRWSASMPVALVQPLPERLWRTTALPATTARITAPGPAAPNAAYTVDPYVLDLPDAFDASDVPDVPGGRPRAVRPVPLPVLEASPTWLANWSSLVAGGGRLPGAVGLLGAAPPVAPVDEWGRGDVERLSPEELLLRFRSLASPEAFRLAGHLAVGRPELPVMRLVHAAIEKNPRPQHLAEVILSGALTAVPGTAGSYAFRPGVRELLLRTLPRTAHGRTSELLSRVGALIDVRAGVSAGEFKVAVPGPGSATAGGEPFAAVREESVRRLGGTPPERAGTGLALGRYRLSGCLGRSRNLLRAEDTRTGRTVAVHRYPVDPEERQGFLEAARALAGVEHPNVAAVHDYGMEGGTAYLVMEFVEGVSLADLTAEGGFRLPFALLAPLVRQIAQGLEALHARGMSHGHLVPRHLLLDPNGTVRISGLPLDRVRGSNESDDLYAFGLMLRELTADVTSGGLPGIPAEHQERFTDALACLLSPDTGTQHRGKDRFLSPTFGAVAEAAAADLPRYRLLGPVHVHVQRDDLSRPVHSPEEQALLCLLLLRNGRPVRFGELTEGLWGNHPPQHPERLLATYAFALRRTLGPGLLATTAYGYALHAGPGTVDLEQCKELVAEAEAHREDGSPAAAREAVQRALDLWYGDPLDGVPGPAAQATRTRLRALRLTLCATRAELDLESGRFERAATDLGELLRSHPEREDFRRLHILALKAQGRTAEAIESYEAHEALQNRQFHEPDPTLLELYRELRATPDDNRPAVVMECTDPGDHRGAHNTLSHTLSWLLSLSGLTSDQYDMNAVDNGYLVTTAPGTSVLNVLRATLRDLPDILLEVPDPPRIRLTFWHTARPPRPALPPALERSDIVVLLSPVLHEELTGGDLPTGRAAFRPLRPAPDDGAPPAWYCRLEVPDRVPDPEPVRRDLVRGPFRRRPDSIRPPEPGRTALVARIADGEMTLLDPDRPPATLAPGAYVTYYEVDLTTQWSGHRLALPSSRGAAFEASIELSWRVDDPVAFVRGESVSVSERLLGHVVEQAERVTRRHTADRVPSRGQLHSGLHSWPVPGLSVTCSVRLRPQEAPQPAPRPASTTPQPARRSQRQSTSRTTAPTAPPRDPSATFLVRAPCVLIGFDGPLVRLYTGAAERQATRELTALLAESRNPQDALSGEPLTARAAAGGAPAPPLEGRVNPLDLLRSLAGHPLGGDLRRRLNRIEERAVSTAASTPFSDALITTLSSLGRRTAVVADNAPSAVWKYLQAHGRLTGLVTGGVHGRADDLTRLMPNPDCLLRALEHLGATPKDAVLVGSSVAELTAAKAVGLRFLGYTRSEPHRQRLVRAGCELTTASWAPLLRALPHT